MTLGRFVSADPVVPSMADPQALNRYSYVLNNPLRYTDPTGLHHDPELERENQSVSEALADGVAFDADFISGLADRLAQDAAEHAAIQEAIATLVAAGAFAGPIGAQTSAGPVQGAAPVQAGGTQNQAGDPGAGGVGFDPGQLETARGIAQIVTIAAMAVTVVCIVADPPCGSLATGIASGFGIAAGGTSLGIVTSQAMLEIVPPRDAVEAWIIMTGGQFLPSNTLQGQTSIQLWQAFAVAHSSNVGSAGFGW